MSAIQFIPYAAVGIMASVYAVFRAVQWAEGKLAVRKVRRVLHLA